MFTTLCVKEFQFEPQIAAVKRLGHAQAGRIQPLLVHLKQADQAKQLIDNAKKLRWSSDVITRDNVFINPNLTRAEALAAYEVRVQRRLAAQRRVQLFQQYILYCRLLSPHPKRGIVTLCWRRSWCAILNIWLASQPQV